MAQSTPLRPGKLMTIEEFYATRSGAPGNAHLTAGTRPVSVVDCDTCTITEYEKLLEPRTHGIDDRLEGRDVVPGFRLP